MALDREDIVSQQTLNHLMENPLIKKILKDIDNLKRDNPKLNLEECIKKLTPDKPLSERPEECPGSVRNERQFLTKPIPRARPVNGYEATIDPALAEVFTLQNYDCDDDFFGEDKSQNVSYDSTVGNSAAARLSNVDIMHCERVPVDTDSASYKLESAAFSPAYFSKENESAAFSSVDAENKFETHDPDCSRETYSQTSITVQCCESWPAEDYSVIDCTTPPPQSCTIELRASTAESSLTLPDPKLKRKRGRPPAVSSPDFVRLNRSLSGLSEAERRARIRQQNKKASRKYRKEKIKYRKNLPKEIEKEMRIQKELMAQVTLLQEQIDEKKLWLC